MIPAILSVLILIPTLIAALLFSVSWMIKYNPALLTELQGFLIPANIIGGILLLLPLVIGLMVLIISLWGKFQEHKDKQKGA